jgi:hypothetical protein
MNIDKSTITRKIITLKASYTQIKNSNPDKEIKFEFFDDLGNQTIFELDEIPNGEIILEEFEDSNKLSVKIFIDGSPKGHKVLFDNVQPASNPKIEFTRESPQVDAQTGNFLQGIVKTFSDGQKEFLLSMKEQFNSATQSIESRQRDSLQDMRNQQKEFMDYMKTLNQSMQEEKRKYEEDHKRLIEENARSFQNKIESDIEFKKKEMDLLLQHQNRMNQLEIEKVTEKHQLELSRINLVTDKTTPAEWSKIIVETLPELTKGFKEAVDAYKSVKDFNIKEVN